jgi:hypothetical protein
MEQDKQLKEILLNSAESAPAGFTDAVMQKLKGEASLYYQPLVSPALKRLFVFISGALIAAILGLCLIIALTNPNVITWIRNIQLPQLNYSAILIFILTFWIVFTINYLFEKKFIRFA